MQSSNRVEEKLRKEKERLLDAQSLHCVRKILSHNNNAARSKDFIRKFERRKGESPAPPLVMTGKYLCNMFYTDENPASNTQLRFNKEITSGADRKAHESLGTVRPEMFLTMVKDLSDQLLAGDPKSDVFDFLGKIADSKDVRFKNITADKVNSFEVWRDGMKFSNNWKDIAGEYSAFCDSKGEHWEADFGDGIKVKAFKLHPLSVNLKHDEQLVKVGESLCGVSCRGLIISKAGLKIFLRQILCLPGLGIENSVTFVSAPGESTPVKSGKAAAVRKEPEYVYIPSRNRWKACDLGWYLLAERCMVFQEKEVREKFFKGKDFPENADELVKSASARVVRPSSGLVYASVRAVWMVPVKGHEKAQERTIETFCTLLTSDKSGGPIYSNSWENFSRHDLPRIPSVYGKMPAILSRGAAPAAARNKKERLLLPNNMIAGGQRMIGSDGGGCVLSNNYQGDNDNTTTTNGPPLYKMFSRGQRYSNNNNNNRYTWVSAPAKPTYAYEPLMSIHKAKCLAESSSSSSYNNGEGQDSNMTMTATTTQGIGYDGSLRAIRDHLNMSQGRLVREARNIGQHTLSAGRCWKEF